MALGDRNNNSGNNGKTAYSSTFYSRLKIKNNSKLVVSFQYFKGLMKIILSEEADDFKTNTLTEINLSPTKAKMLSKKLKKFIDDMKAGITIDPNHGEGVNAGLGETVSFIAFKVTGNRPDIPEHSFVLGKVNGQGEIQDAYEFVFNADYNYSLNWSNVTSMQVSKEIDQFVDIDNFRDALEEYCNSAAGAIGASVWDTGRYEVNKILNSFNSIYDKLGIERYNSNKGGNGDNNFFNKQGVASMNPPSGSYSESKSYEEVEDMFGE